LINEEGENMNFSMSYSFGKDSAFALYKMIKEGHKPICLITTINNDTGKSWTHGINSNIIEKSAKILGLPIILVPCSSKNYETAFEEALKKSKNMGANACVFGDMDINLHLEWNKARCANVGMECIMPLWGLDRRKVISEELDIGFTAVIKCIQKKFLGIEFLGKTLNQKVLDEIQKTGADICGENGEYHTLVIGGPIYKKPIEIELGDIVDLGDYAAIDIN
jgi:uncharacterized protein (TIGR00290 family)